MKTLNFAIEDKAHAKLVKIKKQYEKENKCFVSWSRLFYIAVMRLEDD